ncbi:MAG TPA: PilW family protein [Steroidobacteraceae bacterium]|jgi:type IV pilus assembly protein PilW
MTTLLHPTHASRPPSGPLSGQRGFSLIELMVAILIALFLIGGVIVVEQGVHRSYQDDSGFAQLEDEERFAMTILAQAVESAGYYPDPTSNVPNSTVLLPETTSTQGVSIPFAGAQSLVGIYQATAPYDSIAARFVAGPAASIDLCTGTATTSGVEYTTYLYVANGSDGKPYLNCELATAGTWAGSPVQLVAGIQNMSIMYGVSASGSQNVQSYMFASDVTTKGYWPDVSSVKVTLTVNNPISSEAGQPQTVTFTRVISVMGRMGGS